MPTRVPLLADARLVVGLADDADVVLRPPPQREPIADVAAAVRDALRFPLDGAPLERLVTRGGKATIVVEQPSLPIPGVALGPRHVAIATVADELEQLGVAQVTILVATGLGRRPSARAVGTLVPPEFRRRFRGRVLVHDAELEGLVDLGEYENVALRVHPALVETDLVVGVTAAETVVHGGPAVLAAAGSPQVLRTSGAQSLLETGASRGWTLALEIERRLGARVPVTGISLVLNVPRVTGAFAGYADDPDEWLARLGRLPKVLSLAPAPVRKRLLDRIPRELTAAAVFGGAPSIAHAEALVRGTVLKGVALPEQLDALVIGVPPTTASLPREQPNPVNAAYLGLGLPLRLWRNAPPLAEGGTAILLHPFTRRFERPTQTPYRRLFAPRSIQDTDAMREAESAALTDERAIAQYRTGHSVHPLQPFLEWSACDVAAHRLGAVLVAGCRDAQAVRQLGFVPVRSLAAALEMARGRGARRIGWLLSPPYFPLVVGEG